ncbi:serine hydrolase domain-containing protein [Soonwooa sp.]|uniref:serine hydrolase domain-containing protein n=1 Tax=Soonwooa sp. TaxID=1938592 RepID=UPI002633ABA2|nr:serine hydrolase domain-containing protein [Soonwooa sp.]
MKVCLLLLFFPIILFSQTANDNLDKELSAIYKNSTFPGFAVGIIKNDSVYFSKGYGWANVQSKTPFTENTIIPLASVSKTFIAFSIAKAIELGYFTEETPINDILPFSVKNPYFSDDIIRVKHLYTHTSTILDDEKTYLKTYEVTKRPTISLDNFLKNYLNEDGNLYSKSNFSKANIGTQRNYSNIASALAAYLIEIKSGLSFDEFTKKYIFQPLKMENTHWFYDENASKNYATLYEVNPPKESYYKKLLNKDSSLKTYSSITYPDGSLKSSLKDLSKYVKELIKGNNHSSQLLADNSYQLLYKKQYSDGKFPQNMSKSQTNQAVFWEYNRKDRLNHTGSDPGVYTVISIDLKSNIGRIILLNTNIDTENNKEILENLKKIANVLDTVE